MVANSIMFSLFAILVSFTSACNLVYDYDKLGSRSLKDRGGCPNGIPCHQVQDRVYKTKGQCYRALSGCYGCLNAPGTHTTHLRSIPCDGCPAIIGTLPLKPEIFTSNAGFHAHCPDPKKSSPNSWCSASCCSNPDAYIQVNFKQLYQIKGVGTLGRANYGQWVKSYKLQYSTDGKNFIDSGIANPLVGNIDQNSEVIHQVNINAKSLRFTPVTWQGWKSMRIEAYGKPTGQGQVQSNAQGPRVPPAQLQQAAFTSNGGFHSHCPDARKSSSSSWCVGNGGNQNPQVYLQVNLGKMYLVKKIGTLGRKNYGQWVKSYNLEYSEDCNKFVSNGMSNPLVGNNDQNTEVFHKVNKYAKCLRVIPVLYHGWKSMRLEVYGYWEM